MMGYDGFWWVPTTETTETAETQRKMIPDFVVVSFVPLVSVVSKLPLAPLGANYPLYHPLAGSACELPFNYPFSGAVSIRPNTGSVVNSGGDWKNHAKIVAKRNINIVTPRRSKCEFAESDNATMLRRGGLPLFIGPCGVRLIVVRNVGRVITTLTYQCGSINKWRSPQNCIDPSGYHHRS